MKRERIHPLDSLRGFAALGVTLFWHYSHFGPARVFDGVAFDWLYRYGLMLVDFFFVLSGFVLSHVYLDKLARRDVRPSAFFVLRFSRLYPLHCASLLFVAAMQWFREGRGLGDFVYGSNDAVHFVLNLLFLQQGVVRTDYSFNGPAWSLTVEEVSYLCFFVSLFFFAKQYRRVFGLLLVLGIAINLGAFDTHVFNLDISRGLVGFFAGCLAFQLRAWARRAGASGRLALLSAVVFAVTVGVFVRDGYPRTTAILIVHSLVMFPALVLLVLETPLLRRILSFSPFTYLGEISYSLYMLHFPVQIVLATLDESLGWGLDRRSVSFFSMYAFVTLGVSAASFQLFERPVQAWIRRRWLGGGA